MHTARIRSGASYADSMLQFKRVRMMRDSHGEEHLLVASVREVMMVSHSAMTALLYMSIKYCLTLLLTSVISTAFLRDERSFSNSSQQEATPFYTIGFKIADQK